MSALSRVAYFGPQDPGCTMTVKPTKAAPSGDFTLPEGIVVRTGKASGVVCFWSTIALHIGDALATSPELLADIEAACAKARGGAS